MCWHHISCKAGRQPWITSKPWTEMVDVQSRLSNRKVLRFYPCWFDTLQKHLLGNSIANKCKKQIVQQAYMESTHPVTEWIFPSFKSSSTQSKSNRCFDGIFILCLHCSQWSIYKELEKYSIILTRKPTPEAMQMHTGMLTNRLNTFARAESKHKPELCLVEGG